MSDHPTEQVDRAVEAMKAVHRDAEWCTPPPYKRMLLAALDAATPPLEELPEYPFEVFLELLRDLEMSVRIPDNDKYQRTVARLKRPCVNDWLRDEDDEYCEECGNLHSVGSVGERDQP